MTPDFKPSELRFAEPLPFPDTFERVEAEVAAYLLVRYLARNGDGWGPATLKDIFEDCEKSFDDPYLQRLILNPFVHPSFQELRQRGFSWGRALEKDSDFGQNAEVGFTELGYSRIKKWVVRRA
jgi:hypothetical protein